jgi:hypothetical protein
MKRINQYFIGALLLGATSLGFTSCDLDEYNPSSEGATATFATEQGMENLVNQLYYNYKWKYYGREDPVLYFEGAGDIWANVPEKHEYGMQLTRFVNLQGDRGQVKGAWERNYDNINVANTVLQYLPDAKNLKDATRDDFEGEARFTRAFSYWWLVEWFGDIEMRTKGTDEPVFTSQRTDRKVIYDEVIIPDCEAAAAKLPVQPHNGDIGRATKKAAYGLLARVCLTRAQYEAEGSAEQRAFYLKAYEAAKYVIDNKSSLGISLYATYDEIWQAKNNKNNTEFLWVVSHSSNSSLNPNPKNPNRLHLYWAPRLLDRAGITSTATTWEYPKESVLLMPTYYFLKLWQDWDIRYDVLFQEEFPESNRRGSYTWEETMAKNYQTDADVVAKLTGTAVANDDIVLQFTKEEVTKQQKLEAAEDGICLVGINDTYETENVNAQGGCRIRSDIKTKYEAFPRFMKYRIWDRDPNGTILLAEANGNVGFADVPVIRYAEMPLIAAEAQIALGNASQAAQIINSEIRNARVVKPGHSLSEAQVSASDMTVEWILEERARELCGEWLRWFDLKRTRKLVDYMRQHNPTWKGENGDVVDEHNYLWPIPNTFLDKLQNAEEFGQNPGYDPYVRSN